MKAGGWLGGGRALASARNQLKWLERRWSMGGGASEVEGVSGKLMLFCVVWCGVV